MRYSWLLDHYYLLLDGYFLLCIYSWEDNYFRLFWCWLNLNPVKRSILVVNRNNILLLLPSLLYWLLLFYNFRLLNTNLKLWLILFLFILNQSLIEFIIAFNIPWHLTLLYFLLIKDRFRLLYRVILILQHLVECSILKLHLKQFISF